MICKEQHERDLEHEKNMLEDEEYFLEWTCENFKLDKPIYLYELVPELSKHCAKYDNDVSFLDILDYLKGV